MLDVYPTALGNRSIYVLMHNSSTKHGLPFMLHVAAELLFVRTLQVSNNVST